MNNQQLNLNLNINPSGVFIETPNFRLETRNIPRENEYPLLTSASPYSQQQPLYYAADAPQTIYANYQYHPGQQPGQNHQQQNQSITYTIQSPVPLSDEQILGIIGGLVLKH